MQRDISYFLFRRERWFAGVTRYFSFVSWIEGKSQIANMGTAPRAYPLRETFRQTFKLDFENFLGIGLYVLERFQSKPVTRDDLLNVAAESDVEAFLKMCAMTASEVRGLFPTETPEDCSPSRLAILAMKPLILLDDGSIILTDWSLYGNALGRGWFLTLRTIVDAQTLSDAYGKFLERYCFALIKNAAADGATVLPEQHYNRKQEKSSDAVVFLENAAVFCEVVGKRLNFKKSVIEGDITAIEDDIAKMCLAKAEQLDRNIKDFRAGKLRFEGIHPSRISDIFPVVVVSDPLPQGAIGIFIAEYLQREALLQNCHGLEVVEISLLEGLNEEHGVVALIEALRQKARVQDRSPFKQFVGESSLKNKLRTGLQIRGEQERLREELQAHCAGEIAEAIGRLMGK